MKLKAQKNGKKRRKKSRGRVARRGPGYWMAVGTVGALLACAPGEGQTAAIAAVRGASAGTAAVSAQGAQASRFDIPPGPLETVLIAFQNLSRWRVQVPHDALRALPSPGVSGVYTAEQALRQLLAGTGVTYRVTAPGSVTLELQTLTASVDVTDRVAVISSPKYTEPLRDVPQTVTIIPEKLIEEQGATTLRDVLRNVPGLTMTAGEGGAPAGDNLTLRGFSARNDIFVDGVRDLGPQSRDPFNLEQVEVTKGPSSAYVGRGSTGGTINLVSKSPGLEPSFGGTLMFGTDKTRRVSGDVNLPLKRLGMGERTAFRLNLLWHENVVAGRDVVENERWGVAPSLAFGLGTPTRLTLSYYKLKQDNLSDYGIPWVPATNNALRAYRDRPAPVPRDTFYGLKSRDAEKMNADMATVKFEHDFDDAMTLRNQLRYGRSTRDSMATPPRFASNDSTTINREMRSWITEDQIWDNQTDLRGRFTTGKIVHAMVGGAALTNENNLRWTRTAGNMPTTLLNPNPDDVFTSPIVVSPIVGDVTGKSAAIYAFDTARLGERWELTGGLRWDYFDVDGINTAGAPVDRTDRMLSYRAGAVYKPRPQGSVYAAYGVSYNPSLEGLSYGTANTAIDPEKTNNFEIGSKWDLFRERLSLNAAIFRIDKANARTPGLTPNDPPQVLQGNQRVNGIELGAAGNLSRAWQVFGAYTLLDSRILDSNNPAEVGKRFINTPRNSFNIWTTYQFRKLTVGGGPRFVGRRFGNNTNTREVESYWTIDGMASYQLTSHIDLRLNLYNLNDAYYFDRLGGGHIVPGPARVVALSAGFRF